MHADTILLVRCAERDGRDDRTCSGIRIGPDVHGACAKSVYWVLLDAVGERDDVVVGEYGYRRRHGRDWEEGGRDARRSFIGMASACVIMAALTKDW